MVQREENISNMQINIWVDAGVRGWSGSTGSENIIVILLTQRQLFLFFPLFPLIVSPAAINNWITTTFDCDSMLSYHMCLAGIVGGRWVRFRCHPTLGDEITENIPIVFHQKHTFEHLRSGWQRNPRPWMRNELPETTRQAANGNQDGNWLIYQNFDIQDDEDFLLSRLTLPMATTFAFSSDLLFSDCYVSIIRFKNI